MFNLPIEKDNSNKMNESHPNINIDIEIPIEMTDSSVNINESINETNIQPIEINNDLPVNETNVLTIISNNETTILPLEINDSPDDGEKFIKIIKDQDTQQRFFVSTVLLLELYRMLTSSLLILFVPQACNGHLCTITENLAWISGNHLYNTGLVLNFITLFTFSTLYYAEIKRENRLIKYLDVNISKPNSNDDVEKTLEHLQIDKKSKILSIDKYYQIISYTSIGVFIINSIISGIIVNNFYLGSQTNTTLLTSLLFMVTKLNNVYNIANTAKNIFYSAYLKTNVQFNDIDIKYKYN